MTRSTMRIAITIGTRLFHIPLVFTGHQRTDDVADGICVATNGHSRSITGERSRRTGCDVGCRELLAAAVCGDGQRLSRCRHYRQ